MKITEGKIDSEAVGRFSTPATSGDPE